MVVGHACCARRDFQKTRGFEKTRNSQKTRGFEKTRDSQKHVVLKKERDSQKYKYGSLELHFLDDMYYNCKKHLYSLKFCSDLFETVRTIGCHYLSQLSGKEAYDFLVK